MICVGHLVWLIAIFVGLMLAAPYVHASPDPHASANDKVTARVLGGWNFLVQYTEHEQPFWTTQVGPLTQGQVEASITSISTLGLRGSEVIRLLKLGEYDFGNTVLAYGSTADAIMEGPDLAGLNTDIATAKKTTQAFLPVLNEHFKTKHGIRVLGLWPYPVQIVFCKTPIKSIAELKGRQVRVGTRPIAELIEALGGVAVNIPFGDAYERIKSGSLDCAVTGSLPGNHAKLHEITQYLYPLPLGWSMAMYAVNEDYWSRLPPATRQNLEQGLQKLLNDLWDTAERDSSEGIRCNTGQVPCTRGTSGKMQEVMVSEKDRLLIKNLLQQVIFPRWADRCGSECAQAWQKTIGKAIQQKTGPR
jgi:TRAP-type C4-dicarboxylate transport system substrate-binding protein